MGGEVQPRPGPTASHSTPSLTAPVRHGPAIRTTERPRQLAPIRSASASCRVLSRHLAHHSHCRPPSAPPKAPADRRRPRIYPNSSPDHPRLLLPLPTSSVLTPSIPVHRWIRVNLSKWYRWSLTFAAILALALLVACGSSATEAPGPAATTAPQETAATEAPTAAPDQATTAPSQGQAATAVSTAAPVATEAPAMTTAQPEGELVIMSPTWDSRCQWAGMRP